ncbi:ATP-binding response regulator [Undibacterium macrobrachii]|uniref:histidine kinase n=1 Tax=Undibacterium macrobrachii TaxID=1119058 RepID=A0ABQ2XQ81_9BURK|nr:hybrid sensor histidine kinase/response regulator [Undibacterium macrobrachii]GGX26798.1 hybrid sensor histidine kinase/response regulator [Undibacterium macrobrachii]
MLHASISVEKNIRIELQLLLMRNLGSSMLPGILVALVLFFTLKNEHNRVALGIWCAAVTLSKLIDVYDARKFIQHGIQADQVDHVQKRLMLLHAIDGAVWGALAWIGLQTASTAGSVLILAVLAGIAANSMSILSPVLPAFALFLLFELGSMVYAVISLNDPAYWAIGIAVGMYAITLMGQAYNTSRTARASIQLRFENLDLIEQLSSATKKAEQALVAAEKANAEKSHFLAAASHDLRQPIHAQGLFLEVLQSTNLSTEQKQLVESICSAANATTEMLHTLLDYSRIEAGVVETQVRAFRLQHILNKIENELAPQANIKGLVYRSPETHHVVFSDPTLVEMIIRNLVSNAIRYTNEGGVLISARKKQGQLSLEVWDTGIGIASTSFDDIFKEFQQLGNSERDRQKGLGLGLSIVQKMVQILGLKLQLASRLGKGSVFKIQLPLAHVNVLEDEPKDTPAEVLHLHARILVIDDDTSVRHAMASLLTQWGCTCDLAASMQEANSIARSHTPDLIISDYRLRDHCKGTEVIDAVRAICGTSIPAILVTGDTAPVRLREASASALPLLHKPVSPSQLHTQLSLILTATSATH